MLKRTPIDRYVRKATLGLPHRERIDTAAELRTHLLQKTRERIAEGFPREEAEHLAVLEMGNPQVTNRGLLGHAFTHRLGWGALALALGIGAGLGWLRRDDFWPRDTRVYQVPSSLEEVQAIAESPESAGTIRRNENWQFTLPKGTQTLEAAFVQLNRSYIATVLSTDHRSQLGNTWKTPRFSSIDFVHFYTQPVQVKLNISQVTNRNASGDLQSIQFNAFTAPQIFTMAGGIGLGFEGCHSAPPCQRFRRINQDARLELNRWLVLEEYRTFFPREKGAIVSYSLKADKVVALVLRASDRPAEFLPRVKLRMTESALFSGEYELAEQCICDRYR